MNRFKRKERLLQTYFRLVLQRYPKAFETGYMSHQLLLLHSQSVRIVKFLATWLPLYMSITEAWVSVRLLLKTKI